MFYFLLALTSLCVSVCLEISVLRTGFASRLRFSMLEEYSDEIPFFQIKKHSPQELSAFLEASQAYIDVFWRDEDRFFKVLFYFHDHVC